MIRATKIAILTYIHYRGWCSKLHKEPDKKRPWGGGCPVVDRIILDLYPPMIFRGSSEAFLEAVRKGIEPGSIINDPK